jgi:hypothetical protein
LPAVTCYNLKENNKDTTITIYKIGNFDFNEFIKYLQKNIEKQNNFLNNEYHKLTTIIDSKPSAFSSDGIIIIFKENVNVNHIKKFTIDSISYDIIDKIPQLHAILLDNKKGEFSELIEKIKTRDDLIFADINHFRYLHYEPNDPYWNESWGHKKINCDRAWDFPAKMNLACLIILDSGIDADHEDLKSANIYQWDFIENDGTADDDTGTCHGTNVAGIALARINNNIGLAGVAGESPQIEVFKIFDEFKRTTVWLIIKSIIFSVIVHPPFGPSVVCMCFGNEEYNLIEASLLDTLRYGYYKTLFVSSVGNSGSSNRIDFPAGYKSVIAVGAINKSGCLCRYPGSWGSSYNKNKREVDIVAPGIDIITTTDEDILNKKYGFFSGTSAAAAYVGGVAALWYGARAAVKGYKQRRNEPDQCEKALFSNAITLGDKDPYKYGHGMVDAYGTIPKLKSNKEKYRFVYKRDMILNFLMFEKNYKNIFIKILLTNDFLNRLMIINYINQLKKTFENPLEDRYT